MFVGYTNLLLFVLCLVGLCAVSWRIIEISAAKSLAAVDQFGAALDWDGSNVAALDGLAEREITRKGPTERARAAALADLTSHPLDDRPFAVLALDASRNGRREEAEKLMQIAGKRSWRYPITQAWLFSNDVANKRYLSALEHLDALMRLNEDNAGSLVPLIASFTTTPEPSQALSTYLGRSPPWRSWVLKDLALRLLSRDDLVRLFHQLQGTPAPPTKDETASLLDRLVKDQKYAMAKQIAAKLTSEAVEPDANLYNGDFSLPVNGSPFNWRFMNRSGVEVGIFQEADGTKALRLDFAGRTAGPNVQQVLTLPPGLWMLSGEVRAVQLTSDTGVEWQVSCEPGGKLLNQSDLQIGNFGWRTFSTTIRVPEQGCDGQRLALVHPARVASEEPIRGQIWYRKLKLSAETKGRAK